MNKRGRTRVVRPFFYQVVILFQQDAVDESGIPD